jgi:hypothetical protein
MVATKPITQALKIAGLAASVSLASLAISPEAHAVVITRTASFSGQIANSSGPFNPLTINQYNPILGDIINSITINVVGSLTTTGTIRNNSTGSRNYNVTSTVSQFAFEEPNLSSVISLVNGSTTIGSTQTFSSVLPGQTRTFDPQTLNVSSTLVVDPGDYAALLGGGTFSLSPSYQIGTTAGGGSGLITNLTTLANANLEVAYDVTNVPEPTTMLGMLALTGTGAAMMKKFKGLVKLS